MMTPDQILQQTSGPDYPKVRAALSAVLHRYPNSFLLAQFGNTLFLTTVNGPHDVTVNMQTADQPVALAKFMHAYAVSLAKQGVQTVHAHIDNPAMLRLFHMGHIPFQVQGQQVSIDLRGLK